MRKNHYWIHILVYFCMCSFVLSTMLACEKESAPPAQSSAPLRLSITRGNSAALLFIAQAQGYLDDSGLDISLQEFQSGQSALGNLLKEETDIATAAEFAFVSKSFTNPDLRIICVISTFKNKHLIYRTDKGIQTPSQIKGKRIGVTRRSGGEFFLGQFLQSNNIKMAEVEIIDLKPKQITESLIIGQIDAALTWEPHIFNLKKLMENTTKSLPAQGDQDNYLVLVARAKWLETNKDKVDKLLQALQNAENFISNKEHVVKHYLQDKFLYEEEYLDSILPELKIKLELPEELIWNMELEAQWRIENGLEANQPIPDYRDRVYLESLLRINSEAVTIR